MSSLRRCSISAVVVESGELQSGWAGRGASAESSKYLRKSSARAGIGDNASVNTIARLNAPVLRKDFPTACITALRLFVSAAKSFLSPYHMQKLHPAAFK